ncbi:hypothetical protein Hypma_014624 [Hypsizygus marmoreus]|uniref:Uncharacterized protein n=1 Tax=Hypsizygus marmoreus TaxID=39966 RepID=A0A369J9N5_HYPMA|nr:hypothetical protein Hypma_014624 [Hypsizygus marmoreus]
MPPFPTEDLQDRDLSHQLLDNFMTSSSPLTGFDYYSQGPSSDNFSFGDLPNYLPPSYGLPIPPIPSLLQTMLASTSPPPNPAPPPVAPVAPTRVLSPAVVASAIDQHPASPIEPAQTPAPTSPVSLRDAHSSAVSPTIPHPTPVAADDLTSQAASQPISGPVEAKRKTAAGKKAATGKKKAIEKKAAVEKKKATVEKKKAAVEKKTATGKKTATKTGQPRVTPATDSNITGKKRKRAPEASTDSEEAGSKELESIPARPKPRPIGKSRKTLNETDINAGDSERIVLEEQTAQHQSRQRKPSAKAGVVVMWEQAEQERMARKKAKVTK